MKSLFEIKMDRRAQLIARLSRIAMWAAAFFAIGIGCLSILGFCFRHNRPAGGDFVVIALAAIPTIATGFVAVAALTLRDAIKGRWRFSLAGLLIAMTVVAAILGAVVWELR